MPLRQKKTNQEESCSYKTSKSAQLKRAPNVSYPRGGGNAGVPGGLWPRTSGPASTPPPAVLSPPTPRVCPAASPASCFLRPGQGLRRTPLGIPRRIPPGRSSPPKTGHLRSFPKKALCTKIHTQASDWDPPRVWAQTHPPTHQPTIPRGVIQISFF